MRRLLNRKILILLAVLSGGYYAYTHFFGHPGAGDMHGGAAPVSVAEVIEREVRQWHEFSGRLIAVDWAEIRPRVSGTIETIHFKEGEWVEKGAPLFTIDPRPYQAALEAARSRANFAQAQLKRSQSLVEKKIVPPSDYDQRKNEAEVAKAELTQAELNMDYAVVKAPFAGHVGRPEITIGNLVNGGGDAPVLTTLVSDKPIYADFDMDEQGFLTYLQKIGGDRAKLQDIPVELALTGEESFPHRGHVQSFDNQLNMRSGTIRVRAVFENEDRKLIPGLFARIRLGEAAPMNAVLITDRAIGTDQNKKYVLVVDAENKVAYRPVTLGSPADGLRVVTEGLQPGEKIVVNGLQRARPGMPVIPEMVPMDRPDAPTPSTSGEAPKAP